MSLYKKCVYYFSAEQNCLPCLVHVVNLAITDFMSVITKIAQVDCDNYLGV